MDVYVVINQAIEVPGVVVGAAASLDGAYEIADRHVWPDGIEPRWIVDLDTGVHRRRWAGVWQEVVRVPLAGAGWYAPDADPLGDVFALRDQLESESDERPSRLGYPR